VRTIGTLAVLVVIAGAAPVSAQDAPRFAASIKYQALRLGRPPCTNCAWNWYGMGFNLDVGVPVRGAWHIVGELGWARHPFHDDPARHVGGLNAITAGAGPRWHRASDTTASPFLQVIVGLQRDSADGGTGPGLAVYRGPGIPANSVMIQPGAGILVPMSARWGWVGHVDYRRVFADPGNNGIRLVAGIRLTQR
jgi:hypothetical protein